MRIRIFEQGTVTVIEAPDDAKVHRGRDWGLPDLLELGGPNGQEAVLLTESVALSAARLGLYGLRVVEQPQTAPVRSE